MTFEEYLAFVEQTSAYDPADREISGACGVVSELGELLALFDERRVARKGRPSDEAVLAELGDVLWYEVWRVGRDVQGCYLRPNWDRRVHADWREQLRSSRNMALHALLPPQEANTAKMLRSFGWTLGEIAEANVDKLTARLAAGTLHDREARAEGAGDAVGGA